MVGAGLPVAVAAKVTLEEHAPWAALTVMLPGQVMAGAALTAVTATAVSSRLSGSGVAEETAAMLLIVPEAPLLTFTASVKAEVTLAAMPLWFVQVTFLVPPTDGDVKSVQPD